MRMARCGRWVLAAASVLAAGGAAPGQDRTMGVDPPRPETQSQRSSRPRPEIAVRKLTLSAVGPAQPYLRYALLPAAEDQEVGNAATLYLAAATALHHIKPQVMKKIDEALEGPLEKVDPEVLRPFHTPLGRLRLGARRTEVDWGTPFRTEGWMTPLVHLSPARTLSRVLAVAIRVDVRNKDYPAAVEKLRTGYALAWHLGQGTSLIEALVGMAVEGTMDERLAELIEQPDAPNFYWPLTNLPRPLAELRRGLAYERAMMTFSIPAMKEVRAGRADADTWMRVVGGLGEAQWAMEGPLTVPSEMETDGLGRMRAAWLGIYVYPTARRFLIDEKHMTAAQVDALPAGKALSLFWVESYDRAADDILRWFAVPYPQAREGLANAVHAVEGSPYYRFNKLLGSLPALERVHLQGALAERKLAALRIVEALRAYAAGHEGRLPRALGEITEMPIPEDPVTGKVFMYEVTETGAVLSAPPEGLRGGMRYEIAIRR